MKVEEIAKKLNNTFNRPLPRTIGECADLLYEVRERRYKLQNQAKLLEDLEGKLKDKIIAELPKSAASGVAGRLARVQVTTDIIPVVTEGKWPELYNYIRKHKRFDLLQRRLSAAAVMEMWGDEKEVPGVERFNVVKVSCTKLGDK